MSKWYKCWLPNSEVCGPFGFCGLLIVTNELMSDRVQFRFPRSKKKRIRKKWSKKPENWKCVPWERVYQIGETLIMHPQIAECLRREINSHEATRWL